VEDDEDTRTLVSFVLRAEGWEVFSVDNALAAIELATAGEFDLYLIDNWIGDCDGNELCARFRSVDPTTPVLFYSGAVYPLDIESAIDSGAQDYLQKPSTPDALVEAILKLVGKSRL
jgi:DNA-binding response OmpR family regulator